MSIPTFITHDFWRVQFQDYAAYEVINRVIGANSTTFDLQNCITGQLISSAITYNIGFTDPNGRTNGLTYLNNNGAAALPPTVDNQYRYVFVVPRSYNTTPVLSPLPQCLYFNSG